MTSADLLIDAFDRVREAVHQAVAGLTPDQLGHRIDPGANSIAWLVWHLTRIQDDHLAGVSGLEQVWTAAGWADRFGLPFRKSATGYGHAPDEVAAVQVESGALLTGYLDAVHEQTVQYVASLTDDDLARVVDTWWDPPVTLAVRLVSVIADDLQHAGQAAFIRGHLSRKS
jgi:uncharacterized damage-inducible protein DinB